MLVPRVKLSDSSSIPQIGYGTFKATDPKQLTNAIHEAIKQGYRHFDVKQLIHPFLLDLTLSRNLATKRIKLALHVLRFSCAWVYQNENVVGSALSSAIEESNGALKREDFFLTGKIWNTHHSKTLVKKCLQETLDNLKTNYLDLLLIHWPFGYAEQTGKEPFPFDENGKMRYSDVHYIETYAAMEELVHEGKVRNIGLSNFNKDQVRDVLENCKIRPVVNQFEINIYNQNIELVKFCHEQGLVVEGYAPLGANDRSWSKPEDPKVLENKLLQELALKYNRSVAQIAIKWVLQRNCVVLVKSVTPERIKQNINVFDFELSDEDLNAIANIESKFRFYRVLPAKEHKFYPFEVEA